MYPIVKKDKLTVLKRKARNLASFFVPHKSRAGRQVENIHDQLRVVTIIPTYKPTAATINLIQNLVTWYDNVKVVVVDDSDETEIGWNQRALNRIAELARSSENIYLIKTPQNLLKAGALNYGLAFVKKYLSQAQAIVTCDDDIVITQKTVPALVNRLYSAKKVGSVCSTVRIKNKNKNLLTRLQGLEYFGFNVTKLADNGFFKGPLVMQGMLTATKMEAICEVDGYSIDNLIEDYEITANLKKHGWTVAFEPNCWAWTDVPSDLSSLWHQRIRWTYGGLTVVGNYYKNIVPVLQDIIGHLTFLTLVALIILSFVIPPATIIESGFIKVLLITSFLQFSIAYLFSIFTLDYYTDGDWKDSLIRLSVLPELFYSNFLSLVLIGAYVFYFYNKIFGRAKLIEPAYQNGLKVFSKLGYSLSWGTRK